ncbi:MAG: PEP-CTERM sorting domain-containing protein [Verrucomicrobia bacterium]|nr:PEP-CTERM sorting domain-containing protein [Verrucomicrobiota bacterium]
MKHILTVVAVILALGAGASARAAVTGQWEFNGDFSASVGLALEPAGIAASGSQFGTTTALGVPDINGEVAQIMSFPKMGGSADGYKLFPNAAANGSTADVNQYSLVMDILYPSSSGGYRALFQTSAPNNNDADWFVNGANGLGTLGAYYGSLTPDTWHRIALVVDLEQTDTAKKFSTYIDGVLAGSSDLGSQGAPGGRYSVWPASSGNPSWIFSDEDGETAVGYVNSVQFCDAALSAAEIAALGGPTALGIGVVPEPATGLLLLTGLGWVAWRAHRRND